MFIIIIIIINTTNFSNNIIFWIQNQPTFAFDHIHFIIIKFILLSYETPNIVICDNSDVLCT